MQYIRSVAILVVAVLTLMALFTRAADFSGIASGANSALILTGQITPNVQDLGQNVNVYVAAEFGGRFYVKKSDATWAPLGSPIAVNKTVTATSTISVGVTDGTMDLSDPIFQGLNVYIGYGLSEQDMLNSKFGKIYTINAAKCTPSGIPPAALLTCRNWIEFAPPRPFNPNLNVFPSETDLRKVLSQLYSEGWRGLVTYSLDGTLQHVPRIAKEIGFTSVVAGLYWYDDAQLARERAAALAQVGYIDAYVLGNEGIRRGRYTTQRLATEIASLKADTGRPVATSEPLAQYQANPTLVSLGDWVFPNLQAWFDPAVRTPALAVSSVQAQYQTLLGLAPGRTLVVKEAWFPTAGEAAATPDNQAEFFRQLAATTIKFVWGEAYDQYWKSEPLDQGPNWGLHTDTGTPKPIITTLEAVYTGAY